jgi:hypothetical protein
LHRGDDDLHYSDNSHRWIAPSEIEQEFWEAELAAHLEEHRACMGSPSAADAPGKCRTRAPRPGSEAPTRVIPARQPASRLTRQPANVPVRQPGGPAARQPGSGSTRQPGVAASRQPGVAASRRSIGGETRRPVAGTPARRR